MPPPALVPITLQPQHGSAITVQTDSYRPEGSQAQIVLFSSTRLDPSETYTITVTKTNATLANGVNIDSFIITQPDGASSSPVISSGSSPQPTNIGPTIGGIIGGVAVGILFAFFLFRWWIKRRRALVDPSRLPIPLYTGASPNATPPRRSKGASTSTRAAIPAVTDRYLATLASAPPSASQSPNGSSVHRDAQAMVQVQQSLAYTPPMQGKARYTGNTQPSSAVSASSTISHVVPPTIVDPEAALPAYSRH